MFSALFWKHVRQVRSLFWQGGLVILAASLLTSVLNLGQFRYLGSFAGTSLEMLVPATLLLMTLPVAIIAIVVQVLSGDATDGCEAFLVERPVRPFTLWLARWAAAASLAAILAVLGGVAMLVLAIGANEVTSPPTLVAAFGLVSMTSALVAVCLGAQRIRAVILGFVILFGYVAGLAEMADLFEPVPRWAATWSFLGPCVLASAVLLATRAFGEPAGRRRTMRGLVTLAIGLAVLVPAFLVGATVLAQRPPRSPAEIARDVRPSPAGTTFVAGATDGRILRAWILPSAGGTPRAFLPAPIQTLAWKPDGSMLAMATRAAGHGATRSKPLVRFVDESGADAAEPVELWGPGTYAIEARWARDRVLLRAFATDAKPDIWVVRSGVPAWRFHLPDFGAVRLLGASADGTAYIAEYDGGKRPSDFAPRGERERLDADPKSPEIHVWLKVFRLRPGADAPDEQPVLAVADVSTIPGAAHLSRDGRLFYYLEQGTPKVVDLATGAAVPFALHGAVAKVAWLDGNRLLWSEGAPGESRVYVAGAGEEPRELARGLRWILPEPSPDGRRVLVTEVEGIQGGRKPLAYWLYDDTTQRWSSLGAIGGRGASLATRLWWAGNDTLLRTTSDAIELVPLAEPGKARRIWD